MLADGTHALWYREAASGGHELAEIDLTTGAARAISPVDGKPAMLTAGAYAADGSAIYVATDNGSETHVVVALDRETLAPRATYTQTSPATAEIAAIVPSPRGDVVAVMINAGNHSSVRLLDARTLAKLRDVDLPLGTHGLGNVSETRVRLGGGTFADDGAHFTLNVSVPGAPDDIYLVDTATAHAALLRAEPRRGLAALPPVTAAIATIPAHDGLAIPTNTYVPVHAPAARLPVIVWLHGGPDASTALEWNAWNRIFTAAGYVVVEPNIRGSTGFGRDYARADDGAKRWDALRDLESVNRWLRLQPWCDAERIAIAGGSFGGYYTLLALAHQPTLWWAGVDLAGPSNLLAAGWAKSRRYVAELGDPSDPAVAQLLVDLSPIHAVGAVIAPLFVYQGKNDAHVPLEHAEQIVQALRARGIRVDYMLAGDEGHTVARRANERELLGRILGFLAPAAPPDRR